MSSVRASRIAIRSVLEKYLSDDLVHKIFWEICDQDDNDRKNVIGMTVKEYLDRFDDIDDLKIVWADDTNAGFGKYGDSVYGNCDDCVICCVSRRMKTTTFYVWCEPLHSDKAYVIGAMQEYRKRHPEDN